MARKGDDPVKIHLIRNRYVFCDTDRREGGIQGTDSISLFDRLPDTERCRNCARKLAELRRNVGRTGSL